MNFKRAQGSFEYVLMLSGVLLVVITMVFLLQGTTSSANNSVGNTMKTASTLVDPSYYIPGAKPVFIPPTPADGAWGTSQPNISAVIAVTNSRLLGVTYGWNGANYSFYDPSLVLSMGLDDNPSIGDSARKSADVSQYGNNGTIYDYTLGLWHMDENTGGTNYDEGVYGNNGTCYNMGGGSGVTNCNWAAGKSGSGIGFDGVDDYVSAGNGTSLNTITTQMTIEFWINPPLNYNSGYDCHWTTVISKHNLGACDGWGVGLDYHSTSENYRRRIYFVNNGNQFSDTSSQLALGQWTHVAITYDGTSIRYYLNGVLDSTYPESYVLSNSYSLFVGRTENQYFNGNLDEVGVYNRSLSAPEVLAHYNAGRAKHDSWTPGGEWNSAMQFDGVRDYVDAGNATSLNISGSAITVAAWIKPNMNPSPAYYLISNDRDTPPPSGGYDMYLDSGNVLHGDIFRICTSTRTGVSGGVVPNGAWSYVAFTFNGTNLIAYQNGSQTGNFSIPSDTIQPAPFHLIVGAMAYFAPYYRDFNGSIDEIRVWNRALSANEIAMQFASNLYRYDNSTWYFSNNNANLPVGSYSYALYTNAGLNKNLVSETRTVHVCPVPFVPC